MAGTNNKGYGFFSIRHRMYLAHRVAWLMAYGSWPPDACCHHCDVKRCVRVSHLFAGTIADNVADAQRKGLLSPPPIGPVRGEHHGHAKLTEAEVQRIRSSADPYAVGRMLGVAAPTVCSITKRRTWAWLK
jgi:hypothetical protein